MALPHLILQFLKMSPTAPVLVNSTSFPPWAGPVGQGHCLSHRIFSECEFGEILRSRREMSFTFSQARRICTGCGKSFVVATGISGHTFRCRVIFLEPSQVGVPRRQTPTQRPSWERRTGSEWRRRCAMLSRGRPQPRVLEAVRGGRGGQASRTHVRSSQRSGPPGRKLSGAQAVTREGGGVCLQLARNGGPGLPLEGRGEEASQPLPPVTPLGCCVHLPTSGPTCPSHVPSAPSCLCSLLCTVGITTKVGIFVGLKINRRPSGSRLVQSELSPAFGIILITLDVGLKLHRFRVPLPLPFSPGP